MKIRPGDQSQKENYKLLIGSVVPRPIAFVSSVSRKGIYNVAPYSFFMAVSSNPPTIAFAPNRKPEGRKDTLNNILETKEFVVNIVTEKMAEAVNESAANFPPDVDEFAEIGLTPIKAELVNAPLVKESPIRMECRLYRTMDIGPDGPGGGCIVVGEVILFDIADHLLKNGRIDIPTLNPLARLAGFDYVTLGQIFPIERKP